MKALALLLALALTPTAAAQEVSVFVPTDEELYEAFWDAHWAAMRQTSPARDDVDHAAGHGLRTVDPDDRHVGPYGKKVLELLGPGVLVAMVVEHLHCGVTTSLEGETGATVDPQGHHATVFLGPDVVPSLPLLSSPNSVEPVLRPYLSVQDGTGAGVDVGVCAVDPDQVVQALQGGGS